MTIAFYGQDYAFSFFLLADLLVIYVLLVFASLLQDWTGFNFREIMDDVEKIKGTVYLFIENFFSLLDIFCNLNVH